MNALQSGVAYVGGDWVEGRKATPLRKPARVLPIRLLIHTWYLGTCRYGIGLMAGTILYSNISCISGGRNVINRTVISHFSHAFFTSLFWIDLHPPHIQRNVQFCPLLPGTYIGSRENTIQAHPYTD